MIGESRSQAVRRFASLEKSLTRKGCFQELDSVMQEYMELGHAEKVPNEDLDKDTSGVFYLPIHAVYKASSSTTKIRAVFDASAKLSSGVFLNDTLLVGPTVHSPLIDVLLRFRSHRIGLIADVSKMYRAVELIKPDRDLFVEIQSKRDSPRLQDDQGVSSSCYAANMAVKQNARDLAHEYPLAAEAVDKSFYVDDGLSGVDDVKTAIILRCQLQDLFSRGGFLLRKWNSSEASVLQDVPLNLRGSQDAHPISDTDSYTKTLGLEWKTTTDMFHLTISDSPPSGKVTKRVLVSDIAKVFDVLGWFSPTMITMKILLQRLWELRVGWDDSVPEEIGDDGGPNSQICPPRAYLDVISQRKQLLSPFRFTASVMHLKTHMLESYIYVLWTLWGMSTPLLSCPNQGVYHQTAIYPTSRALWCPRPRMPHSTHQRSASGANVQLICLD